MLVSPIFPYAVALAGSLVASALVGLKLCRVVVGFVNAHDLDPSSELTQALRWRSAWWLCLWLANVAVLVRLAASAPSSCR